MEIVKTKRFNGYDFTLIYFEDIKGYEIQISKKPYDEITDEDGIYSNKKVALEVYEEILKEYGVDELTELINEKLKQKN